MKLELRWLLKLPLFSTRHHRQAPSCSFWSRPVLYPIPPNRLFTSLFSGAGGRDIARWTPCPTRPCIAFCSRALIHNMPFNLISKTFSYVLSSCVWPVSALFPKSSWQDAMWCIYRQEWVEENMQHYGKQLLVYCVLRRFDGDSYTLINRRSVGWLNP